MESRNIVILIFPLFPTKITFFPYYLKIRYFELFLREGEKENERDRCLE